MAGYIRLPRDSAEMDRLTIGNELYLTPSTHPRRPVLQTHLQLMMRLLVIALCIPGLVTIGIDADRCNNGLYLAAFPAFFFAIAVNATHTFYQPLLQKLVEQMQSHPEIRTITRETRTQASITTRLGDAFVAMYLFVGAIFIYAAGPNCRSRWQEVSIVGATMSLTASLVIVALVLVDGPDVFRLRIKITCVAAEDESEDEASYRSSPTRASSIAGSDVRSRSDPMVQTEPVPIQDEQESTKS